MNIALNVCDVLIELRNAILVRSDAGLKLSTLCRKVRKRCRQLGECPFGCSQCGFGIGNACIHATAFLDTRLDLALQHAIFGIQTSQCDIGIRQLALFAFDVGGKLRQSPIEFVDALFGAFFFAVQ